ncbi:MAG: NUDIX hydrolase [Candidatus Nanohaloarchaea archaeon]|nr:NUDIX hydrolase [Candidatus Nanohaloarchaea archaeon]
MSEKDGQYIPYEVYSEVVESDRGDETGIVNHGGRRTWGNAGAGLVVVTQELEEILLLKRSRMVSDPNVWGIPGGARKEIDGEPEYRFIEPRKDLEEDLEENLEDPLVTAVLEAEEELGGLPRGKIRKDPYTYEESDTDFFYDKFVLEVGPYARREFEPDLNWEHDKYSWWELDSLEDIDLHYGVEDFLNNYEL